MLIIAIAAAVVIPSLSEFALGRSSENAAQQILNLAQYARSQCVSEGRTYRMNFDQQAGQIWLTAGSAGVFNPPSSDFGKKYSLAEGMKMVVQITPQPNTVLVMTPNITPTDIQPAPQFGQPVWPLTNTVMQLPRSDGTYVEFQPSGRIDPALIRLTDKRGTEIDIGAATSTEPLHRVTAMEMR